MILQVVSIGKYLLWGPRDIIRLVYGKNCRKPTYLMVKTMVSCGFSLKPIQ
jgi:hypothetical protein